MTSTSVLELDGTRAVRIRRTAGPRGGGRPTLVLLTAWPQTLRCWDAHWDALAEGHDLVAIEPPGFGRAPLAPRRVTTPSGAAAAVAEALDRLGVADAVVVGPDVGVPIALRLAQDRPDLVAGLVLFDGPASFPPRVSWEGRMLVRSRVARAVTACAGVPFALETIRCGYRRQRPSPGALWDHLRSVASPRRFAGQLAFVGSYPTELPVIEARLREITAPALVTWGLEDPFVLPEEGRRLAAALPGGSWQPFAGCGHYAHEDAGAAFAELLEGWVAGLRRGAVAA